MFPYIYIYIFHIYRERERERDSASYCDQPQTHKQIHCEQPGPIHLFAYVMGGRVGMRGTHFFASRLP